MFTSIYKKIKLVATNKFFIALAVVIAFASLTSGINLAKAVTSITNPIFLTRLSNVISTYPTTARLTVGGAVTQGGGIRATSTTGTVVPLLAADFDNENMIDQCPRRYLVFSCYNHFGFKLFAYGGNDENFFRPQRHYYGEHGFNPNRRNGHAIKESYQFGCHYRRHGWGKLRAV